ncbi:MAG TPA: glutathione binding-like protein [Steroidobacteraceae bacterium]|jgi:glutathione S-transferase|nr:glutathione binding-like protein [Steroidobacteraceae bacterium]
MDVYFSPLACSMASRIALYEAGATACFKEVDPKTKLLEDGSSYLDVYPLGLVPAIRTDHGDVITENAAVLQYIGERFPDADLIPLPGLERTQLQQWLCFIGTELHKGVFTALFDRKMPSEAKTQALERAESRLAFLAEHLAFREYLLSRFSVADAYLFAVLNWHIATPVDLKRWPVLADYYARLKERPSICRALREEHALYAAEQARHKAA